jgi:CIC family chloride channel protein
MGIAIGALAVMFTKTLDWTEDLFENLKISNMIKPAIGGLLLGSLAIFYPQVLADGYQTISLTLYGDVTIWLMVILIFAKMLATCLTLGSGNSGGIFAPSLFMGAVAGGAFGVLVNYLFPGAVATPGAFALVGMAAMVAGTTHAPITAMLIIYEMTWDYRIILPLMVAVVFSALVAGRLFPHSIYTAKLFKRGIDIRGGKDVNVLRSYKVTDVMDDRFEAIPASMTLLDIFHVIEHSRDSYFIVKNARGEFKGVISFQDIRNLITQHELDYLVIAQDLVVSGAIVLNASDDLEHAQKLFGQRDFELMPVVRKLDPLKVVGVVRREALTDFYNKRLLETLRK